jgi:hypothetical protein
MYYLRREPGLATGGNKISRLNRKRSEKAAAHSKDLCVGAFQATALHLMTSGFGPEDRTGACRTPAECLGAPLL